LVIGGYHFSDCVKKVGEMSLAMGINTIIDLDLTDLFFSLYSQEDYFNIEQYNPNKYREYMLNRLAEYGEKFAEKQFNSMYPSFIYGFDEKDKKTK